MAERTKTLRGPALVVMFALSACGTKPAAAPISTPPQATPAPDAAPQDRFGSRLDALTAELTAGLEQYHVPGMAVAVVHGDSVIYAQGFGYSDLDSKAAVTPRTLFAIGSSTKAFTATVVGQLVDEGKMSWDDPLVQHVPEFKLAVDSEDAAATATIRDALCHRTGFTRMGVLWASGNVPRREFLAQAARAEPLAKFRDKFLYNNVTYTAAGEASAQVAGVLWAELVETKILEPLGMNDSIVLSEEAKNSGRMATGYSWEREKESFKKMPMRTLDEIAPAGAINSNVLDMTRWLRFQLAKGEFEGTRLIQEKTLAETWKPQIEVGGPTKYGLGWFIEPWNDKTMLHHGGNIDGYSAMVSFIPEADLGLVMLSNVSYSGMQSAVRNIVYETLLSDPAEAAANGGEEDLTRYEGKFLANFGPFAGKSFTVTSKDDKLFVDVPGQQNYELKPPGEDGRRPFAVTDTVKVSFSHEGGRVVSLRLLQGGLEFELFREGFVPEPEVPLAELKPLLGEYDHPKLGRAKVLIQNNRLAIDVPKQMIYELSAPGEDGRWHFRVKDDIEIEFIPAKKPSKVVLHQDGQTFELVRRKSAAVAGPTVAQLGKKRRSKRVEKALTKVGTLAARGKIHFAQAGLDGTVMIYLNAQGEASMRFDLGRYGWSHTLVRRDGGWEASSFGPLDELVGKRLLQALQMNLVSLARDLERAFEQVEVTGTDTRDGTEVVELRLSSGELPPVDAVLDAATGDVLQVRFDALWGGPGAVSTTERYSDFKSVLGLRIPHRVERMTQPSGSVTITFEEFSEFEGSAQEAFPTTPPSE